MGLFKCLKGDHPDSIGGANLRESTGASSSIDPKAYTTPSTGESYASPPDPPPSHQSQYQPPQGPPPSHIEYALPMAPPPGCQEEYAPPPGPPPSHKEPGVTPPPPDYTETPPYHDWTVIPDNSLLPPPPSLGHERGSAGNADAMDADRAHDWCRVNPLVLPHHPTDAQFAAVENGDIRLMKPREYKSDLLMPRTGLWKVSTRAGAKDACLLTASPLYFASADSPTRTKRTKTIYFEVDVESFGHGNNGDECSIAIGYCAMPYPSWRMPGWERGSLAVHSDDGRRYVNDPWGGQDFTSPIHAGDTIGLGMSFAIPDGPPEYGADQHTLALTKVEVFFTRNGNKEGGWNLHEELDKSKDLGVEGLDGLLDIYGAVGIFGGANFNVKFKRDEWLWRPRRSR